MSTALEQPATDTRPYTRLVSSWCPLANEALRVGHAARVRSVRADARRETLDKMLARPLPDQARLRRWAMINREDYRAETERIETSADALMEQWAALMDRLAVQQPDLFDAVVTTVWNGGRSYA